MNTPEHQPPELDKSSTQTDDVSLFELADFLLDNLRAMLTAGAVGLGLSGLALLVLNPQYEARALLEMASNKSIANPVGLANNNTMTTTPVENPELLSERLRRPSSFTPEALASCATSDEFTPEMLSKDIKASPLKKVLTVLDLTIQRPSPEAAQKCVNALVAMITVQQTELLGIERRESEARLKAVRQQLGEIQDFIAKSDRSGTSQTAYLARRDDLLQLKSLEQSLELSLLRNQETRLVSPIYVTPKPVSPKVGLTLALGLLAGLFLGLLSVLARKGWREWQAHRNAQPTAA